MKNKNYRKFLRLTTKQITDNASILILIIDLGNLISETKNTTLINTIYNKLMSLFFQHNNLTKKYILKVLKKHIKKLKSIDPVIYKTEILNNLLGNDLDCSKYVLKFIELFKDRFVNDFEIVAEVKYFCCKSDMFDEKNENEYTHDFKNESIERIVEYVEKYRNKNTVKLMIKYPVLCQNIGKISIKDKHFLSLKEAQKMYSIFGIFEPEWNAGEFKKVKLSVAISERNYVQLFFFFDKYLEKMDIEKCNTILRILIDNPETKLEYKYMFKYFHNTLNDIKDDMNEVICEFYGITTRNETKHIVKQIANIKNQQNKHLNCKSTI